MVKKAGFSTFVIIVLLFLPIAIPIVKLGSKPVDIVLSDTLLIWAFILFLTDALFSRKTLRVTKDIKIMSLIVFFNIAYGFFIILPYMIKSGGDIIPLVSAVKFYKSILLFYAGIYFANKMYDCKLFFHYSVTVVSLIIVIMLFSTILDERFPVILWGENFFNLTVYGFPNTGMAFIALIMLFPLAKYYITKQKKYIAIYTIGVLMVIFSLSRSSFLVLFFGSIFLSFKMTSIKKMLHILVIFILIMGGTMMLLGNNEKVEKILDLVQYRIDRTMGKTGDDPTSGRTEIWTAALEVINNKPIFGYGFEPFSNRKIGHYDTPHQQYLEIIYKTGFFGFLLYMSIFLYASLYISKRLNNKCIVLKNIFLAGLLGIMVSNLTQPNFSFALTGNILFFLMGFLVSVKEEL